METIIMIIAFSNKTSKILPRILCGELKHVAPITGTGNKMILHQFIRPGKIAQIPIQARDLGLLAMYGWKFIRMPNMQPQTFNPRHIYTCVHLTKRMIGMRNICVQTPNALYKTLK
ncbi:MAG: hypothetical protein ACLRFO_01240 [Alphaproteobacteria bacterium]